MAICVGCGMEIPTGEEVTIEGKVYCPGCGSNKHKSKGK